MTSEPKNDASERTMFIVSQWTEWAALRAHWDHWYSEDFVREDRRRLVNMPIADRSTYLEHTRIWFEIADGRPKFLVTRILAVRGQRLCAWVVEAIYKDAPSLEAVIVPQFDADVDRIERQVHFDLEDVEDAISALDAMNLALGTS